MQESRKIQRFFFLILSWVTMSLPLNAWAAGFQLWEQDGASIGNYHAGRSAIAEDASTAFYNPAGLVRIPNAQFVLGLDPLSTDFLYTGTIAVARVDANRPHATQAQGGTFNLIPDLHYSVPINDHLRFGLSVVPPFGLKTDYGANSIVRYAATLTSLEVVDVSPSVGIAVNDKLSIGLGFDLEHASAVFNLVATAFAPEADTDAKNSGSSNAWGYHLGILYQFTPTSRVGVSYHSKVIHRFTDGESKFTGLLANSIAGDPDGEQISKDLSTNITLPATTSLSIFHSVNTRWDVMGTVSFTQWEVFNNVILKNVAGITTELEESNNIQVIIPQNFINTWNYSVGANYHVNEKWFLRAGMGYDQTPSNDNDRNLQLPDGDRIAAALGTHLQATKTLGFDVGWTHFFTRKVPLNVVQIFGGQTTTTVGSVEGNADVFGFQMKWDIL